MIPNNNLSVLPWYESIEQQNARKWWVYGRVYPLFTQSGYVLPFQLIKEHNAADSINFVNLYDANTNRQLQSYTANFQSTTTKKQFASLGYDVWVNPGEYVLPNLANGRYYLEMVIGNTHYYSEIFTVVGDIEPYLKISWWDDEDFTMDAGTIVYESPSFRNILYLQADIAKPEYIFEEEGETRDGYFFPVKQISEKRYRFNFLASEYLLDVMRLIRMADHVLIDYHGKRYSVDTFLITPDWENEGDVAVVEAVFETATVAKKIGGGNGSGPIIRVGDYNNDFNNDFSK